jgi:hypothetical protein
MIAGAHRGAHKIKLNESNGVSINNQVFPVSRWVLGSLLFIANMYGDLNLQEPESCEVIRSGTGRLPPAPVHVDVINKA